VAKTKMSERDAVVSFEGPPDAVEAYVPVDPLRRREVRVSIASDDGWTSVRALTAPAGNRTLIRLVLPSTTPAGALDAVVELGDERYEAVVRTSEAVHLEASPASLDLAVEDSTATATLNVVNLGNVAVDVPDISAFGVMMEDGVETAIGTGLMTRDTGIDRVGRFADALAERHGGLARVSIESGAGRLEPGSATTVRARIELGDRPVPGRTYHGLWPLGPLRIVVLLRVPDKPSQLQRPRRTPKGASKK
jgi:hypothetical protein